MARPVNICDAKTQLSQLVDRAAAGEEIVIAKAGVPTARLVPLRAVHESRVPARWAAQVEALTPVTADRELAAYGIELLDATV